VTISHVHCQVRDLPAAVAWFTERCEVPPSFNDGRMAVFQFGAFTLILDAASSDSVVTIGFNSADCNADFASMVARGARVLESPQDRQYGARAAYLQGPGAIKIEIEQLLSSSG
jgi:predicted enzyme related to lactoylglutathione lyase